MPNLACTPSSSMISRLRRSNCTIARAAHALAEILVGCDDEGAIDLCVRVGDLRRRSEGVVGLVLHHRPRRHSHCDECFLDDGIWARSSGGIPSDDL